MNYCLPWGEGSASVVQRRLCAPYDQTDLNLWFRLILIGGGRTFQKLGPFGARGAGRPHNWAGRSRVGPLRVHFGQWVLDPSRCFFLRC
jgi:hypothetical protein